MGDKESVKDFYGKQLTNTDDLGKVTQVTQCAKKMVKLPPFIKDALSLVHTDITQREYGCATAYPEALEGARILDLGSGCGRDCFVLSKVVGENGRVVGLDMTDELLKIASDKIDYHTQKFGYSEPNVSFVKGYMEKMGEAGLQDDYFNVIVSNCVISLCRDKKAVLREASRVLTAGGEMYFSDMYRNGQLPPEVMDDENLWCEGLIGSLTYKDLHQIASELGFTAPRLIKADPIPVVDEKVKARLGGVTYAAVTYRLFKKASGDSPTSVVDVTYKGGIPGYEDLFEFDHAITFQKGSTQAVSAEVGLILQSSRFSNYFKISPTQATVEDKVDVDPFQLIEKKSSCSAAKCSS